MNERKNKKYFLKKFFDFFVFQTSWYLLLTILFVTRNVIHCQNDYSEDSVNDQWNNGVGEKAATGGLRKKSADKDELTLQASSANDIISTKLTSLDVICGKEFMTVLAEFNAPFNGIIFSGGTYGQSKCVYVKPHSGQTHASFNVRYDECGTKPDLQGKYFENTIVIQYGTDIIEALDEAKRLRCEWFEAYEKPATFRPAIPVADLDIIEMNFQGDEIDCWMSIQEGKGPWSHEINRIVTVGQPLSIVVAINDHNSHFDMKVKSCFAHDGIKSPIYLIDEDGCVLRPKMISPFRKLRNAQGKASLVSYAQFLAFKFPDSVDVQIQCTVEVCRHGCSDSCDNYSNHPSQAKQKKENIKVRLENITSHFTMEKDLLESANTNAVEKRSELGNHQSEEQKNDLKNFAEESSNNLKDISEFLNNFDKSETNPNDYSIKLKTLENKDEPQPLNNYMSNPPQPEALKSNNFVFEKNLPLVPQNKPQKLFGEPVAQIMNIPLSPIYAQPQKIAPLSSSLTSLLNPFANLKIFKKQTPIPQSLSNYFSKRKNILNAPNDFLANTPLNIQYHESNRVKRYINDKQGEIGLKKGFQVVTALDLSFQPNISADQMPVYEGKPESIVYGICFSSINFIYVLTITVSLLISGILTSFFIVYKLEKLKQEGNKITS